MSLDYLINVLQYLGLLSVILGLANIVLWLLRGLFNKLMAYYMTYLVVKKHGKEGLEDLKEFMKDCIENKVKVVVKENG